MTHHSRKEGGKFLSNDTVCDMLANPLALKLQSLALQHNNNKSLEQSKCTGEHHGGVVKILAVLKLQSIPLVTTHEVPLH